MKITRKHCLKLWADVVKERDFHTCRICGATDCKLDAHHIIDRRYCPFELWNGLTLCSGCHKFSFHSAHGHPVWFAEFLEYHAPHIYNKIKKFEKKEKRTLYKYIEIYKDLNGYN